MYADSLNVLEPRRRALKRLDRAQAVFQTSRGVARWVAGAETLAAGLEAGAWSLRALWHEGRRTWRFWVQRALELLAELQTRFAHIERVRRVALELTRVILVYRGHAIAAAFRDPTAAAARRVALDRATGRRLATMCAELGGGMVKLGQMAAARRDLLPAAMADELSVLLNAVAPLELATVKAALAQAWGDERAATVIVDPEPLGVASIAQVHRAVLPDGRVAAIKVLRPGIAELLAGDMQILRQVVSALTAYLPDIEVEPLLDDLSVRILGELDLKAEANNLRRAAQLLADLPGVEVPQPLDAWCGEGVLATSFHAGERLDRALDARVAMGEPERAERVLATLAKVYAHAILLDGFIQTDAHPGNFLVAENDTLICLDFGCVVELDASMCATLRTLVRTFLMGDDDGVAAALATLGVRTRSGSTSGLVAVARQMLGELAGGDLWDLDAMLLAGEQALALLADDPVTQLPPELMMIGRALFNLGGVFYVHKPRLDVVALFRPVFA